MRHRLLILVFLVIAASASQAATITLTPSAQTRPLGSQASVDLVIADLGSGTAPSVGTFDLDLAYDPVLLSFVSATFGNQLDILGLGSIQAVTPSLGIINIFELSLDTMDDLNNLQAPSFVLATLIFDSMATGTSVLTLNLNALGDAEGQSIAATLTNGTIAIEDTAGSSVPEPRYFIPTGLLLAVGVVRTVRSKRNFVAR